MKRGKQMKKKKRRKGDFKLMREESEIVSIVYSNTIDFSPFFSLSLFIFLSFHICMDFILTFCFLSLSLSLDSNSALFSFLCCNPHPYHHVFRVTRIFISNCNKIIKTRWENKLRFGEIGNNFFFLFLPLFLSLTTFHSETERRVKEVEKS